ncbi:hypothetical protein DET65_4322 [Sunxiuqinia elliptica]|uniref:Uncharacterized protein n=1 Tax=Sunxiuqinia elliptica TaxID=655355 RepID=A0A4V3BWV6_9BACT|nr:hypothetical protein DET52_11128 [Sunxiuqinia elliptica]TDO55783.1 hypothetical protein DET65_4322 [Sunxiuqinia elliptica]
MDFSFKSTSKNQKYRLITKGLDLKEKQGVKYRNNQLPKFESIVL